MSTFFGKFFALFLSHLAENAVFALCCKISIAEVRLRFNLVQKCRSAIAEVALCFKNNIKKTKLRTLRCAFTG